MKANSDSGGKANGFRWIPEWLSRSRNDLHRHRGAGHQTGTMNPPREDQSAGRETVHAKTTGGPAPPIRTQTGLPADRAKLRDRGEHRTEYLKRAEAAGVRWPLPEDWDEARLESVLFHALSRRLSKNQPRVRGPILPRSTSSYAATSM